MDIDKIITKALNFISSIGKEWQVLAVIAAIFIAGFKCGGYYTKTIMIREQTSEDEEKRLMWIEKEDAYRETIYEYRLKILDLNTEIINLRTGEYPANSSENNDVYE